MIDPIYTYRDLQQDIEARTKKWDKRYFTLAETFASWSKDPSRKVGAVIIGSRGEILSQGYNGFPRGVRDDDKRLRNREMKRQLIVHAEVNAILNAAYNGTNVAGSTLYVYGLPPCCDCTKAIIQSGISKVNIMASGDIPDHWVESFEISKLMLKEAKINFNVVDLECNLLYNV